MVQVNVQNFCEIKNQVYTNDGHVGEMYMKRTPLNPGTHRMYIPEYHLAIYNANTIGEMVTAMYRALSASGYNNFGDASPELAKKCLAKLNEAKHNTQEV